MTRSEAREQAFFVLFEKSFCADLTINEIIDNAQDADLIKINNFAKIILNCAEEKADEVDSIITDNLRGWTIQRLPKVSLAVLRLAVSEIKFIDDVPSGVSVNEAVELVKKYGTSEDAAYVNGVLGSVVKGS